MCLFSINKIDLLFHNMGAEQHYGMHLNSQSQTIIQILNLNRNNPLKGLVTIPLTTGRLLSQYFDPACPNIFVHSKITHLSDCY